MIHQSRYLWLLPALLGAGLVSAAGIGVYLFLENVDLQNELAGLTTNRDDLSLETASSSQVLALRDAEIAKLSDMLELTEDERDDIEHDLKREKNKNEEFEDQIKDISKTVGTLDKLSKTDKELLQKYSKVYFLNENFRPDKLTKIDTEYVQAGRQDQYFHTEAWPYLKEMLDDAAKEDIDLKVTSAFRSFEEQAQLKGQYTIQYGSGANAFSADQGYSEHQLGTTLDLTTPAVGGPYTAFENTTAFTWMQDNAYKYGFILSYPKANSYYVYEPWHWRFVGTDLADELHDKSMNFYDMDQREISTYLISIFD